MRYKLFLWKSRTEIIEIVEVCGYDEGGRIVDSKGKTKYVFALSSQTKRRHMVDKEG